VTKRASGKFERTPRDLYETTDPHAVAPLLPHLDPGTEFAEPCAGRGALIDLLEAAGHKCVWASDIDPKRADIGELNAMTLPRLGTRNVRASRFITNPPWSRKILHPIIDRLSAMLPCWFLFDSDWAYTRQSETLIWRCSRIVPVGRIKWIPGSEGVGFDNCSWYEFLPGHAAGPLFVPRGAASSALMGPDERRRAEIKARGVVVEPGPLFAATKGKGHGATKTSEPRALPLVPSDDALARQPDAPDERPLADSEIAGRDGNGAVVPAVQSGERVDDGGTVGDIPRPVSGLLAKLRRGLRPVVHPRATPGSIGEG
jgi:hypothetical protein